MKKLPRFDQILTEKEKLDLWKKLQWKYTSEVEQLKSVMITDMRLFGAVSEETKKRFQDLVDRVAEDNIEGSNNVKLDSQQVKQDFWKK